MQNYNTINKSFKALCYKSLNNISLLANASAFLNEILDERCNWCGFYLYENNQLLLGPFQGKVACTPLSLDKGVCGASATKRETVIVPNVHNFSGHIACDNASCSEIVVPIVVAGELYGVLDIDSSEYDTFNDIDKLGLEEFVKIIVENLI